MNFVYFNVEIRSKLLADFELHARVLGDFDLPLLAGSTGFDVYWWV